MSKMPQKRSQKSKQTSPTLATQTILPQLPAASDNNYSSAQMDYTKMSAAELINAILKRNTDPIVEKND